MRLLNKLEGKFKAKLEDKPEDKPDIKECPLTPVEEEMQGTPICDLEKRLNLLK